jgi:hypothetical protein
LKQPPSRRIDDLSDRYPTDDKITVMTYADTEIEVLEIRTP